MPKVSVQYCASLREAAGTSGETLETSSATLEELFDELCRKHHLKHTLQQVKMAINNEFCSPQTPFKSGDHILLMPPFSGG